MEMDSRRENVAQEEGIDLNGDTLTKIFSLLPTEDIVRASFVCKWWKSLRSPGSPLFDSPLSVLDLDCKRFCKFFKNSSQEAQKEKFTDFVNAMFLLHHNQHLEEFRLAFDLSLFGVINPEIDHWVFCAMISDSAILDLKFTRVNEIGGFKLYKLPQFDHVIPSVTVMKLSCCNFLPRYYKKFESLHTVIFRDVALLENAVNDLIDRCPVLEELHINYCVVSSQFNISASTSKLLKCLVLDCFTGSEGWLDSVYINVPSLSKFKYVGELLKDSNFHVSDLDNLIEAYIFFGEGCFSFEHEKSLRNLFGKLRNVNTLTLCNWSIELLGLGTVLSNPSKSHENLPYPLSNLKHLTLHSCLGDSELQGLHRLLRSSPYIETLSVRLSPGDNSNKFWESHAVLSGYLLSLKEIEIKDFHGLEGEIKFLTDILANTLVLEKITIYKAAFRSSYISKEQDEILFSVKQEKAIEVLLDFTRASPELKYYSHNGFCSWVRS